jgi:hypothetical protein
MAGTYSFSRSFGTKLKSPSKIKSYLFHLTLNHAHRQYLNRFSSFCFLKQSPFKFLFAASNLASMVRELSSTISTWNSLCWDSTLIISLYFQFRYSRDYNNTIIHIFTTAKVTFLVFLHNKIIIKDWYKTEFCTLMIEHVLHPRMTENKDWSPSICSALCDYCYHKVCLWKSFWDFLWIFFR